MSNVLFSNIIGLLFVIIAWNLMKFLSSRTDGVPKFTLRELAVGQDIRLSISKLQLLLWTLVVVFSYVSIYAFRLRYGDTAALAEIPPNLFLVLGFSVTGGLGSKGITQYLVKNSFLKKDKATEPKASDLFRDDGGYPAIYKMQLFFWTLIAILIYLISLEKTLSVAELDLPPTLPEIDTALMVLMGISQGAYLGKKVVSRG